MFILQGCVAGLMRMYVTGLEQRLVFIKSLVEGYYFKGNIFRAVYIMVLVQGSVSFQRRGEGVVQFFCSLVIGVKKFFFFNLSWFDFDRYQWYLKSF